MIRVKIYLDKSVIPGGGVGVFAGEDISEGTTVWEFNPAANLTYTSEEWAKMKSLASPPSFEQIESHTYKYNGMYYLCLDGSQYMNHSHESYNLSFDRIRDANVAIRDIKKGEELLCNYFDFCDEDDFNYIYLSKLL